MNETILFVDDEPNILSGYKRQLRTVFNIETANSGAEGLEVISTLGPFAVIVSDLRMPGMDGIQFLTRAKEIAPESVRMMLTGHADINTAIDAVNEGNIFRFLTKPCPPDALQRAIQAGITQYRLVTAEKELLEKTLGKSVKLLTEVFSLANPAAFSRSLRVRRIVHQVAANMRLRNAWQYELAAMLSQMGCIALPPEVLEKVSEKEMLTKTEQNMYASHPLIAYKLLEGIPRLEQIAGMVRDQQRSYASYAAQPYAPATEEIDLGAQILKVALDYDQFIGRQIPHNEALKLLAERSGEYNPDALKALGEKEILTEHWSVRLVDLASLEPGMVLDEEIRSREGKVIVPKGQEVTLPVLERINLIAQGTDLVEPFRVLVAG